MSCLIVTPQLWKKCFSVGDREGRFAQLIPSPPPFSSSRRNVSFWLDRHSSVLEESNCKLARKIASLHFPPRSGVWVMSCWVIDRHSSTLEENFCMLARKITSLHFPPQSGGSRHVGSSCLNFGRQTYVWSGLFGLNTSK